MTAAETAAESKPHRLTPTERLHLHAYGQWERGEWFERRYCACGMSQLRPLRWEVGGNASR
jgi:hypothetical protein